MAPQRHGKGKGEAMSARDAILKRVRASLHAAAADEARRQSVTERLNAAPRGVIPARGQLEPQARVELFCAMAAKLAATVERVASADDVPGAVAAYLRERNLGASFRMGADEVLAAMPWHGQKSIEIKRGASDGHDEVGVSRAFGGIAETGTMVMISGAENPSTINFLPEHHIIVLEAGDIDGDPETVIGKLRGKFGKGHMPRTLNFISGPSRSGDIEQKIILGAHGPRALHVIVVGG
jgi:L-lactate dehydrogenase complex protein LldG